MAEDTPDQPEQFPVLVPLRKPLSLIPVSLKEAALDSPPFRATVVHLSDQFDAVERWLDGYVRAASKLAQEVTVFDGLVGAFLTSATPPSILSEAVMDHDYTLLALQRYGEGAREYWSHTMNGIKKTQASVINPIRSFLNNDVKSLKDVRKQLDANQKNYDAVLARYYSQVKTKEASALREDAFQLHEAKKAYLKSSMDFCVQAPQLHAALDDLLIRVFSDQWLEMKGLRETSTTAFQKHNQEISRIRGWSKEMMKGDRILKRELIMTRVQIEDRALSAVIPSRDLDDYAASTVPFLGNRPPATHNEATADTPTSKQGWLFFRTVTGKPARTTWIRRWYFVQNGIFGWMVIGSKSGGVEESDKIGVLLCSVRPAFQEERRFCFEVKTKDSTLMLQAETQTDLTEWLFVFDIAKQKAIEDPASTELLATSGNPSADPAFAVSPAIAPELAAKEEMTSMQAGSDSDSAAVQRNTADVAGRKPPARGESESGRDHAARFIQKLDLHKKTTAGTQFSSGSTTNAPSSPFGIASLISASHSAMPVGPGRADTFPRKPVTSSQETSLAPPTLVQPPAPTNLSQTAVSIGAERGLDLGVVDTAGGVPSSIMANQWGTTNYGHLSRIERGEVKDSPQRQVSTPVMVPQRRLSDPPSKGDSTEHLPLSGDTQAEAESPTRMGHRKTVSEMERPSSRRRIVGSQAEYPSYYPTSLRAHDTQMRMLFPNVPQDDRAVLVFRASWNPDERQDLPGRVFVTMNELYFYSHHYGFTLVSGIPLAKILDVSTVRQGSHDVLYLHVEGQNERDDSSTITIKTFLESVRILQRRLKFLVSNCSAEEPVSLEGALRILINLDASTSGDADTDDDDDVSPARTMSRRATINSRGLRVDRSLFGADGAVAAGDGNDVLKFRLPTQPVKYSPKGMSEVAVEGLFNVSAKSLFHIAYGDSSVLSQMLYRERRPTTSSVKRYPWKTGLEDERWTRNFEYDIDGKTMSDSQTVDIANDHLCYVVSDLKTPWHLPYSNDFSLVSKIVITHVAKSKCLLRIFTAVDWRTLPSFGQSLIERRAIEDLRLDAQDLFGLVSDQVQKLGPDCYTKKAIQIFGNIGQQNEVAQIADADPTHQSTPNRLTIRKQTLTLLILEAATTTISSSLTTIMMTLLGALVSILRLLKGHTLLTFLLLISLAANFLSTSQTLSTFWHERASVRLISNLGVGPNVALSKSIHLFDIDELIAPSNHSSPSSSSSSSFSIPPTESNKCAHTFRTILASTDLDSAPTASTASTPSTRSAARRLTLSRQRMAGYRHDLLVALRLVNSVEREVVQTEYEHFVFGEGVRCRQVGRLLEVNGGEIGEFDERGLGEGNGTERGEGVGQERKGALGRKGVREWYEAYCGSCFSEQVAVGRGVRGAVGARG